MRTLAVRPRQGVVCCAPNLPSQDRGRSGQWGLAACGSAGNTAISLGSELTSGECPEGGIQGEFIHRRPPPHGLQGHGFGLNISALPPCWLQVRHVLQVRLPTTASLGTLGQRPAVLWEKKETP